MKSTMKVIYSLILSAFTLVSCATAQTNLTVSLGQYCSQFGTELICNAPTSDGGVVYVTTYTAPSFVNGRLLKTGANGLTEFSSTDFSGTRSGSITGTFTAVRKGIPISGSTVLNLQYVRVCGRTCQSYWQIKNGTLTWQ